VHPGPSTRGIALVLKKKRSIKALGKSVVKLYLCGKKAQSNWKGGHAARMCEEKTTNPWGKLAILLSGEDKTQGDAVGNQSLTQNQRE